MQCIYCFKFQISQEQHEKATVENKLMGEIEKLR